MRSKNIKIGKKIRELRKTAGITMKELAEKVGVSHLTIHRVETDKVSPSINLLSEIAYYLNYPLSSLVTEEKSVVHIKGNDQPLIESRKLILKILAHKGTLNDHISVSLGKAEKGEFISKHKNEGTELTYIIKGKGTFKYGQDNYDLEQGDLIYHDGKEYHSVIALEPSEFLNILFVEE